MSHVSKVVSLAAALLLFAGGVSLAGPPDPTKPATKQQSTPIKPRLVTLGCKSGSSGAQDVQKIVEIKNTTTKTMPKGHKINWSASDGDKGDTTLDKALPAGGKVNGYGTKPNLGYTCTASTSPF